jgi:uncharacterized tellurite resistance protein B-like protein|tara:strand:- start:138 stop:584 length:447 start_codon:yes stop_codon:yes gene_type:complete
MLKKIRSIFTKTSEDITEKEQVSQNIDKTCTALIIEVALADKVFDESEVNLLKEMLLKAYTLEAEDIQDLIENAEKSVEESTSLYEYTREVNDNFDYESKLNLIDQLWRIAFADGHLDKYEEHVVRKIADLIHISHNDFIQSKLKNRE